MRLKRLVLLVTLLIFSITPRIFSQEIPQGTEPGAEASRYQKDVEQEQMKQEKKKAKPPPIEMETKPQVPVAVSEKIAFVLKGVKITGETIFKPGELRPIYEKYLDKKITFKDIEAIIEQIKLKYHSKGYLTTSVYLPEQEIESGILEIIIAEGKMGELKIEGNKRFSTAFIEKLFHVKKNEVLNVFKLQRDILRLNKFSDLEVRTVISAGKEPETSDITLTVKDKRTWHAGLNVDNQGTRLTGKLRESIYSRSSNLSGQGDSLFVNTLYNPYTFGQSLSYSLPIGTYGTKLNLDLTYFTMKVGKEFKPNAIRGLTRMAKPHISYELSLSDDFEAYMDVGIDIKTVKKKQLGAVTTNDQLRMPYFSFNFSKIDSWAGGGQTTYSPLFLFSINDFLGASSRNHPSASREGTGGKFFKYEHNIKRIQRMPFESYLSIASQFQAASHTLPSSEQLQLGGFSSIRGYPEGDYLADTGGTLNLDWVFPLPFVPADWKAPYSSTPLREAIEPVFFGDFGGGSLKKVGADEVRQKFLAGIGGGLRLRLFDKIFCIFEAAKRVGDRPSAGGGSATFHFLFQVEI